MLRFDVGLPLQSVTLCVATCFCSPLSPRTYTVKGIYSNHEVCPLQNPAAQLRSAGGQLPIKRGTHLLT